MQKTVDEFGALQIVVNCAGIVHVGLLHEYGEEAWEQLMGVNAKAIYLATKFSWPFFKDNWRSYMVNIASASSFIGQASTPAYTVSKHAALGLTRSIALDYAVIGLRCNCICPGITDTPMLRFHLNTTSDPEATLARRMERVPMGVAIQPADVAKAALYFSCEDSSGITGTSLVIDGGWTACAEWQVGETTNFMEDAGEH
ncbi:MAG: NAD(P)-dependent dehydrogenase (short-subunit alcohol dehydrogenase family) [Candidatus Latescibacterota bacterium]|jgi:NAD(P)-dependent dehydrogenase (short-subunit alcohol dehydrogenase family)